MRCMCGRPFIPSLGLALDLDRCPCGTVAISRLPYGALLHKKGCPGGETCGCWPPNCERGPVSQSAAAEDPPTSRSYIRTDT